MMTLFNRRGSIMPLILILSAVGMVSIFALLQYIKPLTSSFARNSELVTYRLAMDAMLDYAIGAVKQNKCFNGTMMWVDCNDLTSEFNTERLLLSSESVEKIEMSNTVPLPAVPLSNTLPLQKMTFDFDILSSTSPITVAHPLFTIVEPIKFKMPDGTFSPLYSIKGMKITISRSTDTSIPQNDNFMLLKFRVELTPNSTDSFFSGGVLSAESVMVFTPRKLSSHALILASSLDLTGIGTTDDDKSVMPAFSSFTGVEKGLRFESPVFVNGDIIVPFRASFRRSPVAFLDKVYLGGTMYNNSVRRSNLFKPSQAGSMDERYFSQLKNIYGFMGGVDLEPYPDSGLPYLFNTAAPSVANVSLNKCLARAKALTDKTVTRESRLYTSYFGNTTVGATQKFSFDMTLGQINFFVPQSKPDGTSIGTDIRSSDMTAVVPTVNNAVVLGAGDHSDYPIARVTVKMTNFMHPALPAWSSYNEFYAMGNIGRSGVMTVPLNGTSTAIVVRLSPQIIGSRVQSGEVKMDVEFVNQPGLAAVLRDRTVTTCPGQPWNPLDTTCGTSAFPGYAVTSIEPPRVSIDVEPFDVAYSNGQTERMLLIPGDRAKSAAHPFFGSMKKQQFIFGRNPGSSQFVLKSGVVPISTSTSRTWVECIGNDANAGDAPNCVYPTGMVSYYPSVEQNLHVPSVEPVDLETMYDNCKITVPAGSAYTPSFGALAWYYSAAQAPDLDEDAKKDVIRHAWGFVPGNTTDVALGAPGSTDQGYIAKMTFDENAAFVNATTTPVFGVQSRVKDCIVKSTANFVTGLFVCDRFIIESRDKPLRIIGTVIAGRLEVDPHALQAGIRWSSVFNANAMYELQKAGVLNSMTSCTSRNLPHWMPVKTAAQEDRLNFCLPGYLVNAVDPFNWTTVDPDCIRNPLNTAAMICKRHPRRYVAKEVARKYVP